MMAEYTPTNSAKSAQRHQFRPEQRRTTESSKWQTLTQTLPPVFDHTPGGRTSALGCVVSAIKAMFRNRTQALTLRRMPTTSTAPGARVTRRLLRTSTTRSVEDF